MNERFPGLLASPWNDEYINIIVIAKFIWAIFNNESMSAKGGYVYIVSNKSRTVLYTGVTSDLNHRIYQHRIGKGSVFAKRYGCTDLLYY